MTIVDADPHKPRRVTAKPLPAADVSASDLAVPEELSKRRLRSRLLFAGALVLAVIAVITLLPGLAGLRSHLAKADPAWLALGVVLKILSGLGYVVVFRMVFCRRMSWGVATQIGMSELGANALFPTGGAGGLALGAWALRRGGMQVEDIARRTVAFFLLTSVPNVLGVIVIGLALAVRVLPGETSLLLTVAPAVIAVLGIVGALLAGRIAARLHDRLSPDADADAGDGNDDGDGRSRAARLAWKSLAAIADGVDEAVALLREGNALLVAGLIAYLAFDVMILWTSFRAFGPTPPLGVIWLAYLIGELGGLIPVPGGIGGVDVGLVGTLVVYNVALTPATSAVLAYRATALIVPAVLGAVAFVLLRRTLRDESQKIAVCAPQTEMDVIGRGRVVISSS